LTKKYVPNTLNSKIQPFNKLELFLYNDTSPKYDVILNGTKVATHQRRDKIPIVPLFYANPIIGVKSDSAVDELIAIQIMLKALLSKIKNASQLTFEQSIIIPRSEGINSAQLKGSNGYKVIQYDPIPGVTEPIKVATPDFISEQYLNTFNTLEEHAYNIIGISALSAQ